MLKGWQEMTDQSIINLFKDVFKTSCVGIHNSKNNLVQSSEMQLIFFYNQLTLREERKTGFMK